jgi:cobalamin biosynthesis Mg chelatase CobN
MANSIDAVFIYSQQNPQLVAALVRAVRPTEAHVERIAALEARCRRLQDELDATDGEHERSLRALQQEHLKFKSNMERR